MRVNTTVFRSFTGNVSSVSSTPYTFTYCVNSQNLFMC